MEDQQFAKREPLPKWTCNLLHSVPNGCTMENSAL